MGTAEPIHSAPDLPGQIVEAAIVARSARQIALGRQRGRRRQSITTRTSPSTRVRRPTGGNGKPVSDVAGDVLNYNDGDQYW